jgi:hypothetical protein
MDMQNFRTFIQEAATGTKGHAYQAAIANGIASALQNQGKQSKYTIAVAGPSSTSPDIEITSQGGSLVIECKMSNSQSGAITWRRDPSSGWSIYQTAKSTAACAQHAALCSQIGQMLSSPMIENRIIDLQHDLLSWCPKLAFKEGTIPFKFCKEFYPILLDKYPVSAYGQETNFGNAPDCGGDDVLCGTANRKGKWQIPVPSNYWQILDSIMLGDHFLQIQGAGLFQVSNATLPAWFVPSVQFQKINAINSSPKGQLELRLKPSGAKLDQSVVQERELIITGKSEPKVGDYVHVHGLTGVMTKCSLPMINGVRTNIHVNDQPLKYTLGAERPPSGAIQVGVLNTITSVKPTGNGWIIRCGMKHRCGTVGFEANLRINGVGVQGALDLSKAKDCDTFVKMMK